MKVASSPAVPARVVKSTPVVDAPVLDTVRVKPFAVGVEVTPAPRVSAGAVLPVRTTLKDRVVGVCASTLSVKV